MTHLQNASIDSQGFLWWITSASTWKCRIIKHGRKWQHIFVEKWKLPAIKTKVVYNTHFKKQIILICQCFYEKENFPNCIRFFKSEVKFITFQETLSSVSAVHCAQLGISTKPGAVQTVPQVLLLWCVPKVLALCTPPALRGRLQRLQHLWSLLQRDLWCQRLPSCLLHQSETGIELPGKPGYLWPPPAAALSPVGHGCCQEQNWKNFSWAAAPRTVASLWDTAPLCHDPCRKCVLASFLRKQSWEPQELVQTRHGFLKIECTGTF